MLAGLLFGLSLIVHAQRPAYKTIGGTVVNALNGDPVRAAHLALTLQSDGSPVATTESDENGHFELHVTAAAKYQLRASHAGYTTVFYEQHGDFSSAIVAGPDEQTSQLLFRLPPMASLHGTVLGEGGDAVAGASVLLYRANRDRLSPQKLLHAGTAATDDLGFYEFDDLEPGEYRVAVLAQPWYAMHSTREGSNPALDVAYPATYYDAATDEAAALPLRLEPGSREQADFSLHAVAALRLNLSQPHEAGSAGATLTPLLFGMPAPDASLISNDTASASSFSGIAPGRYQMAASNRLLDLEAAASGPVDLQNGAPAADLSGTAETASGQKIEEDALVELDPAEAGNQPLTALLHNGSFQLSAVPAGLWNVRLRNGYGYEVPLTGLLQDGKPRPGLQLATRGKPVQLQITAQPATASVSGFVRHNGKGFAGAMVILVPAGLQGFPALARRDQSDSDGSFELRNVLPGRYVVLALADAWTLDWTDPATIRRFLPDGESVTLTGSQRETLRLSSPVELQTRE